jgi:hypothetical protein
MDNKPFDEGFTDGELMLNAGVGLVLIGLVVFGLWIYMGGSL